MPRRDDRPRFLPECSASLEAASAEAGELMKQIARNVFSGQFSMAAPARRRLAERFGLHVQFYPNPKGARPA